MKNLLINRAQIGDLYYNLDAFNRIAEVTYKSKNWGTYNEDWNITTANIPASVTYINVTYSVTRIGESAFEGCSGLTSVTIPNSVTRIDYRAFSNCTGLTSPVYTAHIFAYMPTSYSGAYTIPDGIESIVGAAFEGCSGLTSVTIPNSVTDIRLNTFCNCTGLTSIDIPNSVTSIGNYAFYGCSGLTSMTIPNSVTSIGYQAFRSCSGLTSVTIKAETPPTLDGSAFSNTYCSIYVPCNAVNTYKTASEWKNYADRIYGNNCGQSGTVVSGTYKIGDLYYNLKEDKTAEVTYEWEWDESNYYGLTSANIPASVTYSGTTYSVTSIGEGAFWHCSSLASATIPNSVTYIGGWAFEDSGITSPVYNSHVFAYMPPTYSGSYSIANGIELLSDGAFKNCTYLTSVTIGNGVTNIGRWTFENCSGLTSVTIPNSVTSIGEGAFKDCSGLSRITIESMTPPTCGSDALSSINACPIYVPCNAVNTYKAAWSNYANRICGNCASYTITFKNWDGSILQSTQVEEGQMPQYTGATPTKPSDSQYSYTFSGWTPQIVAATADATYTATYTDTPRGLGVEDVLSEQVQCTKVVRNGMLFIERGEKVYTLQGQEAQ